MRVLLVGEYSRLHNSLKEGLIHLGHEVVLIGNGDGFKNYPVDINIDHSFHNPFLKKLKVGFFKLTGIDLAALEVYRKTKRHSEKLKGFDVVQLINESALTIRPKYELRFIKFLKENNEKVFLLSCGIDHQCMRYMMAGKFRYSIMTPYLNDPGLRKTYQFQLQYLNEDYTKLHDFIYENCDGIIASDFDYHMPLQEEKKYLGLIPNPINTDIISYIPLKIEDKIRIFHGVNSKAVHKKGSHFFTEALDIIQKKYTDEVSIEVTYDLPYDDYITKYDNCHILLDQVYSYDQGFNALEAMAKGKVVFTGAEKEWLEHFNLDEDQVAINALPDANAIAEKLEWLILNPEQILKISENARQFIEKKHHYKTISQSYLDSWKT